MKTLLLFLVFGFTAADYTQCPRAGKSCSEDQNVCENGAWCCLYESPTPDSLRCLCQPGYAGHLCEIKLEDGDWMERMQEDLKASLDAKPNTNVAKNVIFFVGDGMSMPTITASRIFKGQRDGKAGEEEKLRFETFPSTGFSKTYNLNHQVTDSAAAASAMLCGVKANYGTVGYNGNVRRYDCESASPDNQVDSIIKWSQDAGKRTGIVTTTRVSHATPAAGYAHSANRDWESDDDFNDTRFKFDYTDIVKAGNCTDHSSQLIDRQPGNKINVIMGGGRRGFLPKSMADPQEPAKTGVRVDGRDLTQEWLDIRSANGEGDKSKYVFNKDDLNKVDASSTDFLLGLFSRSHMEYYGVAKENDANTEPRFVDMVDKAIDVLNKGDKGYFLLAEAGRIDQAHHDGRAQRSLWETLELEAAVEKALEKTSRDDTLIIVTADHSHAFYIGGYPSRGNDILGFMDAVDIEPALDGHPHLTLGYMDGQGAPNGIARPEVDASKLRDMDFRQQANVYTSEESHGGDDVPIYAIGPMSHLLSSTHENTYLAHVMAYASCVGPNKDHCEKKKDDDDDTKVVCGAIKASEVQGLMVIALIIAALVR